MGFRKEDEQAAPGYFEAEAAGLRWLAAAAPDGGARIARVLDVGPTRIETERVATAPSPLDPVASAEALGAALARTHASGAPHWGAPPPDAPRDGGGRPLGYIGALPLPLVADPVYDTWGSFYAHERLEPFLRLAVDRGAIPASGAGPVEAVVARLEAGELDSPQPALVGDVAGAGLAVNQHPVARLHGDLWSGNVLWDGGPTGATLIDPAAHGGHAETDLAMLGLFGLSHLDRVLAAYDGVSALADGWRDRVGLHQLHPLLVHAALFGSGYGTQALATARRYE